jgi:hypothetical protein
MRILVPLEPADFRRGIDDLARNCKDMLQQGPFGGWMLVFRNRRATAAKVLVYNYSLIRRNREVFFRPPLS